MWDNLKHMKKKLLLILFTIFLFPIWVKAEQVELSRDIIFKFISKEVLFSVPKSYQYIQLNYKDISKTDKNYEYIQKLVYADYLDNKETNLLLKRQLNAYVFYSLLEKKLWYDFVHENNTKSLKARNVYNTDLVYVKNYLEKIQKQSQKLDSIITWEKAKIYEDVYNTLLKSHYDSDSITSDKLIYWSIEWLAKWSWDKFTNFFPPQDSQSFQDSLNGEFEWIWAHVDMEKPGELKIISPIVGSPAEKAWLKAGDIIYQVGDTVITKTMTADSIVAMIKWPAGSYVKIIILRDNQKITFEIQRAKIQINDVDYKLIKSDVFYIQMKMFGQKVFPQMSQAIAELKKQSQVKTLIIDLRNNPWGYLDQAVDVLSMFIKKSDPVAVVKYKNGELVYKSFWYDTIDLTGYKVYILANWWSASASEIMIGTLKDYFPNIQIIWEKTYWKWSVQTMKNYTDGSLLKYTIAKWYTGKSQTGIDGVGIPADVEVKLDEEKYKLWIDTQLDYILK